MAATGKKKVITEEEIRQQRLPSEGEVLGLVVQLLGYDRILVKCADGSTRLCRIRGGSGSRMETQSLSHLGIFNLMREEILSGGTLNRKQMNSEGKAT